MSAFIKLLDFIPALSPKFMAPVHLRPLTEIFQRIAGGERVRAVVSVPPRNSKTESLLHGGAWLLLQDPTLQIAYASYAARIAEKKSRRLRELARKAGVPIAQDSRSRADWRTGVEQGGCWATSVDGQITGEGFNVVILDDLIKGRAEAESAGTRERARAWLISDVLTRVEPGGSVLLSMARWHPDDPAGAMIGAGWEHVNLTALDENDQPLWPERWPRTEVLELRDALGGPDGYEWQSLYMGNPRGRGARVFGDVAFYDSLPDLSGALISCGIDFAYSTRTSADWSVAVVLAKFGDVFYVVDVVRVREEPRAFRSRVQLLHATHPRARSCAYAASTEMGGVEFFREGGIRIDGRVATIDKFSRAIPVAAAWNTGRILLPRKAPWLDAFISEVCGFTGVKDRHDDQVDALAAAFDGVRSSRASDPAIRGSVFEYHSPIGTHDLAPLFGESRDGLIPLDQWHALHPRIPKG
ncbi:MAG: phage terminase large subunit [Pseudomonadota bacterium]